MELIEIE